MTKRHVPALHAIILVVMVGLTGPAQAQDWWWRAGAASRPDFTATVKACAKLPDHADGVDMIGCGISSILVGRNALARDYFLVVADDDARHCVQDIIVSMPNAAPERVIMGAYCSTKLGDFTSARRLLASLARTPSTNYVGNVGRFDDFRVAVLAHAINGEGNAEKAIDIIREQSRHGNSDILNAELFEIYVEDERQVELLNWWGQLKSSDISDPVLRAICEAQVALVRDSPSAATRVLDGVSITPHQDGYKTLAVARYRVAHLNAGAGNSVDGSEKTNMSSSLTMGPQYYHDETDSELSFGLISARGVNFYIDKAKLNRPGVALPTGYFF